MLLVLLNIMVLMQPENVNLCYGQEEKMSERMGAALPFHALGGKYKNV